MESPRESPRHRGSLVGPAILIGIGAVFLLNNLGMLSWGVWETLLRLWPVLLIAIGLDLLIGRRSWLGSLAVAVLLLAAFAGAVWLFASRPALGEPLAGEQVAQPLGDAARAEVKIAFGVGRLKIGALTDSKNLVEGTVSRGQGEQISREYHVTGDTAYFELRSEGVPFVPPFDDERRTWALDLNSDVPLKLTVDTGVGQSELDLSRLSLTELHLNTGVGQVRLTLPAAGEVQASLNGGVGQTVVTIPAGVAARIRVHNGLGAIAVAGDYRRDGDTYLSPDFDSAGSRVELTVNGGVGEIRIEEGSK